MTRASYWRRGWASTKTAWSVIESVLDDPSNEGQRLERLAMAIGWQAYKRTVAIPLIVTLDNGIRYVVEPRSGNAVGVIYSRLYEASATTFLRQHLVRDGLVVDVGAHTGLFSLQLAHLWQRAVFVEPAPDNFALLQRNVRLNPELDVSTLPRAAGREPRVARLCIDGEYAGTNRISDDGALEVSMTTVDEVVREAGARADELSLLKIDVEGLELDVLMGAADTLAGASNALVLVENNEPRQLVDFFEARDWVPFALDRQGQAHRGWAALASAMNLLAAPRSHELWRRLGRP